MKTLSSSYIRLSQLKNEMKNASVKSFSAHNSKIHSVAWNVDGKRLASGSTDKTVAIFKFENKERLVSKLEIILLNQIITLIEFIVKRKHFQRTHWSGWSIMLALKSSRLIGDSQWRSNCTTLWLQSRESCKDYWNPWLVCN